ncbi:MAG: carbonic anhydrase family protein, partial [Chlorobi bacterium]|nr:carbonic anhydrase family protein [Chlorobiota bacterium]
MKQKLNVLTTVFFLMVFSVFISCNSTEENTNKPKTDVEEHAHSDKKDCDGVHWSHHKGEDGPEKWNTLCEGFSACGGNAQSPINFVTDSISENSDLQAIKFEYGETTTDIINNLHTIQFNVSDSNSIELNGKDYKLLQFHYHALSEHTVNGKYFPLEVHFVH